MRPATRGPRRPVSLLVLGFIPALAIAWIFERTSSGIQRDDGSDHSHGVRARRLDVMTIAAVLILAAILIALTKGTVRNAIVLIAPLIALVEIWFVPDGVVTTVDPDEVRAKAAEAAGRLHARLEEMP